MASKMLDGRTNLQEEVNTFLKHQKIKKYEFCSFLGISRSTLNDYEHNKRPMPNHVKLAIMYLTKDKIKFELL